MYDIELVIEILTQIKTALHTVKERFEPVKSVGTFTDTPKAKEKLDSICMLLIAIGESLKNIDKMTDKKLLLYYSEVDWKGAKGMRDIIAHHYFDVDGDEIYHVCSTKIDTLRSTIEKIIEDLTKTNKTKLV